MPTITLRDQATSGQSVGVPLTLDILSENLTVRELIRSRIYQEVQDFNRRQQQGSDKPFRGLVQPTEAELTLNAIG